MRQSESSHRSETPPTAREPLFPSLSRRFETHRLPILAGTLVVGAGACLLRGPKMTWDLLNYHYYNGYAFLRGLTHENFIPAQSQSFLNPVLDAGLFRIYDLLPQTAAHLVIVSIHLLQFVMLYLLGRKYLAAVFESRNTGLLAYLLALGGCLGSIFLGGVGADHHDLLVSTAFVAALLLLFPNPSPSRGERPERPWRSTALAGLLMGVMTGLKLTAAPYALAVAVALLSVEIRQRSAPLRTTLFGLTAAGGMMLATGWWMLEIYRLYGSPLFPFLNEIFQSPLVATESLSHQRRMPEGVWETIFYPLAFTREPTSISAFDWRDYRFAALFVLFFGWAGAGLVRGAVGLIKERGGRGAVSDESVGSQLLIVAALAAYVSWQAVFPTHRYLSGVEAIAPLVIVALVRELRASRRIAVGLSLVAMTVCVATVKPQANGGFVPPLTSDRPLVPAVAVETASYAESMVIITGFMPSSFVIPSFPESTRFVRVQTDGFGPYRSKKNYLGLYELARERILGFDGALFVLFKERGYGGIREPGNTVRELTALGLTLDHDDCRFLVQPIRRKFFLCPVLRDEASTVGEPSD